MSDTRLPLRDERLFSHGQSFTTTPPDDGERELVRRARLARWQADRSTPPSLDRATGESPGDGDDQAADTP